MLNGECFLWGNVSFGKKKDFARVTSASPKARVRILNPQNLEEKRKTKNFDFSH